MIELWVETEVTVGPDEEVVTGTVLEISDAALVLLGPDGPRELDEASIRRVRQ